MCVILRVLSSPTHSLWYNVKMMVARVRLLLRTNTRSHTHYPSGIIIDINAFSYFCSYFLTRQKSKMFFVCISIMMIGLCLCAVSITYTLACAKANIYYYICLNWIVIIYYHHYLWNSLSIMVCVCVVKWIK